MKIRDITEAPNDRFDRLERLKDVTIGRLKQGSNQPGIPGPMAGGTKPASAVPQDIKDRTMVNPAGPDNPRADIRAGRGFKVGTTKNDAGQTVTRDKQGNTTTTGSDTVTTDKQGRITRVGMDSGKIPGTSISLGQTTDVNPKTGAEKTTSAIRGKLDGIDLELSSPGTLDRFDPSNPNSSITVKSGQISATAFQDGSGSVSYTDSTGKNTATVSQKKGRPPQGKVTRNKT
jgi:hypothetical protein